MSLFSTFLAPKLTVHLLIKGRVGAGWVDIDRTLRVARGTTLGQLIDLAQARGIPMRRALRDSPHLAETLMLNGERCPVAEHAHTPLADGDRIYLLAPLAGG